MSFKKSLPPLYENLLPQEILNFSLQETKATCHDCLRARDQRFAFNYKANLKCCTFVPFIPNFAVGALLCENLKGANIIKQFINDRRFTLPLGIFPDPKYQFEFKVKSPTAFGNNEKLLCHYFDKKENQCSIWTYRGVVCTTFFCRSDYGNAGQKFWAEMKNYLSYVEMALAEDCLVLKDFSPRDISDQLEYLNKQRFSAQEKKQLVLNPDIYKKYWNGYLSEVDFYIECYEIVLKHNRSYFKEIMGELGSQLTQKVIASYHANIDSK